MATIDLVTIIEASAETCFDLSRDLDLHARSMHGSSERAIAGKTAGLIGLGEEVTWQARHFGVLHTHRSRITAYDRPRHFRDVMLEGRFAKFEHDHYFDSVDGATRMRDVIVFESPLGFLGRVVDTLFLKRYLTGLIEKRNVVIRSEAEQHAG